MLRCSGVVVGLYVVVLTTVRGSGVVRVSDLAGEGGGLLAAAAVAAR